LNTLGLVVETGLWGTYGAPFFGWMVVYFGLQGLIQLLPFDCGLALDLQ
jgi:hypothetical protein